LDHNDILYHHLRVHFPLRSHVCWHVYGLLHRADRNYGEAIKAYKQALRIDSENLQILRDLSLLQIQMRDWEGYVITRNSILTLKPTAQANWISFALAKHRSGNYTGALHVIDIYLGTLTDDSPERKRGYTSSELQLYKNRLLLQSSQPREALQHLDQCQTMIVDQDAWLWHTAVCHFALQQYDDAREALYQMMKRGSTEDYRVHMAYQCAVLHLPWSSTIESSSTGMNTLANTQILNATQRDYLLQLYQQDLRTAFPKSSAIRRIPLTLLEGDDLCNYLMTYMRQSLIRGVPSLANDLGSLLVVPVEQDNDDDDNNNDDNHTTTTLRRLSDPVEYVTHPTYQMISQIAQEYSQNLQTYSKFHPKDDEDCPTNSAYLWVLMFQAGWSAMAGQFSDALSFVERVLAMVDGDSKLDAYELHASIIQRSTDDWATAAGILDDARALDPNDRYLNTQTIRAYLRANQWQTAIDRAGLFTHSSSGGNNANGADATTKKKTTVEMLREMQASWFELELADCRVRLGHYGAALQTYGTFA
jgi:N-alpha-acetyltransferase 15/16, NatA auxiliary subunit